MLIVFIILITAILLIYFITMYNRLVRDKNRVRAAWSDINVQLKRRHELIPKLVDVVSAYTRYEKKTLDELTRLRSQSETMFTTPEKSHTENHLTAKLNQLLLIMENYPEIKADRQFLNLQTHLSLVENDIQSARRYYNGAVRNLNIRIDTFPDLVIAKLFHFNQADFFALNSTLEALPAKIKQ